MALLTGHAPTLSVYLALVPYAALTGAGDRSFPPCDLKAVSTIVSWSMRSAVPRSIVAARIRPGVDQIHGRIWGWK